MKISKGNHSAFRPWLFRFLLLISLAAAFASIFGLTREICVRRQGNAYYAALSGVGNQSGAAEAESIAEGEASGEDTEGETILILNPQSPLGEYAVPETNWTPYVDFDSLRETIPGLCAWIYCEGTSVNYPVVKGDDNTYYLGHLPDGTKHKMGSIFLDYRNSSDFSDKHSLVYGHYIETGEMFGAFGRYREQEFYDEHPVIMLYTPEKDYAVALLAAYLIDSSQNAPPLRFESDLEFQLYVSEIRMRSFFESQVEISAQDLLVSLCTCAYDFPEARLVLTGALKEL